MIIFQAAKGGRDSVSSGVCLSACCPARGLCFCAAQGGISGFSGAKEQRVVRCLLDGEAKDPDFWAAMPLFHSRPCLTQPFRKLEVG